MRSLAATSGGDSDLALEATLGTQDDLYRFRTEVLGGIAGIHSVHAALVLRTLKRAYLRLDEPTVARPHRLTPESPSPAAVKVA